MSDQRNFTIPRLIFTLLVLMSGTVLGASNAAQFKVERSWPIGGDGKWANLTLDANARLLYISRATHVQIVDTNTGELVGDIAGFKHTHCVALDTAGKYGYVSDGEANQVVVFDRGSRQVVTKIDAPQDPDFIIFEPKTEPRSGRSRPANARPGWASILITSDCSPCAGTRRWRSLIQLQAGRCERSASVQVPKLLPMMQSVASSSVPMEMVR